MTSLLFSKIPAVNYPTLPRSGSLAPHLSRVGLPVSVSALVSYVDTAAPDSAGGFPSRAVWSVPLLPIGHPTTTDGARFLSSFERAELSRDVARILRILAASGKSKISRTDERRVASFEPRLNTAGGVVSIVLPCSTAEVVKPRGKAKQNDDGVNESLCDSFAHQNASRSGDAVSPPYSAPFGRSVEGGGLAPAYS